MHKPDDMTIQLQNHCNIKIHLPTTHHPFARLLLAAHLVTAFSAPPVLAEVRTAKPQRWTESGCKNPGGHMGGLRLRTYTSIYPEPQVAINCQRFYIRNLPLNLPDLKDLLALGLAKLPNLAIDVSVFVLSSSFSILRPHCLWLPIC